MIDHENYNEEAYFEVNEHGRILTGNRKFCRMFGYDESEIVWHYITDFYRHAKDWNDFRSCDNLTQHHFVARMRNRKGRSFKCSITREVLQGADGRITFRNSINRIGENEVAKVSEIGETRSVVFVAKCAFCGEQMRVNSLAETRMRVLCNTCAAKSYPEAFNLKAAQV